MVALTELGSAGSVPVDGGAWGILSSSPEASASDGVVVVLVVVVLVSVLGAV